MIVKLKRGNEEKLKEIIIAPDFIEVYDLIREGYQVIEVGDEFYTYKEKWSMERDVEHEYQRKREMERRRLKHEKI